jgi:SulP family sulfate permease
MPHRYTEAQRKEDESFRFEPRKVRLFGALRDRLAKGYTRKDFFSDLMSGAIVSLVALPLGMALAIGSGVAPQNGLYTVIIAGFFVALLGGSRLQVTGPTAAFVVVLVPIVLKFGLSGLLVSGLMAGILLVAMGVFKMGRLIEFIPHPVTTGFTSGIAVVIATIQLKDFFGLQFESAPETYFERIEALLVSLSSFSPTECLIALSTLALLLIWPRKFLSKPTFNLNQKIPSPLMALGLVTLGTIILKENFPSLSFATIHSKFSYLKDGMSFPGIPQSLPSFEWPWSAIGHDGISSPVSFEMFRRLFPSAFAIAMLGAIESLLSAVVADGMAKTKHDPDAELVALGIGNILCPFFGGIPATGAIARTATNIRFGATSPISAMIHAVIVLLIVLLFAPYVGYLPMASLAALLILVAYNMAEIKHFTHIVRVAPKSDVAVLLICFLLTVVFDMVAGVTAGIVLAALLFMARMSEVTSAQFRSHMKHPALKEPLPKQILLYEIAGPLFFGAAEKAIGAMGQINDEVEAVIFDLSAVPVLDISGLIALETCFSRLHSQGKMAIVTGIKKQPASLLLRANLFADQKKTFLAENFESAVSHARSVISQSTPPEPHS